MTYLITGRAGPIGSNFVKHMLKAKFMVLEALTYAGNLGLLKEELKNPNLTFVKGDICDKEVTENTFSVDNIQNVINFAAESYVGRSIENLQLFLKVNILGTQNLLNTGKKFWTTGAYENNCPIWRENVKFIQISTDELYRAFRQEVVLQRKRLLIRAHHIYSVSKTGGNPIVNTYAETYKMHKPLTI